MSRPAFSLFAFEIYIVDLSSAIWTAWALKNEGCPLYVRFYRFDVDSTAA